MERRLEGKTVAVLVADGFEQVELTEPMAALRADGATVLIVSPSAARVRGWKHSDWGDYFPVDVPLNEAHPDNFEALLLPGGVMNPDKLRLEAMAIDFIRGFLEDGKPIAAICHGPWPLIDADGVRGRKMTSYPSLKIDLQNAGADWCDREVVTDNGLVTSRTPQDLRAFNIKMIEEFAEGEHGEDDLKRRFSRQPSP